MKNLTPIFKIQSNNVLQKYMYLQNKLNNCDIFYSFKTNNSILILKILQKINAKIVVSSVYEFKIVKKYINLKNIIFHSVVCTENEIYYLLKYKPMCVFVNSIYELQMFSDITKKIRTKINIGIRINTKKLFLKNDTSKFGIKEKELTKAFSFFDENQYLNLIAIGAHIGTNVLEINKYEKLFVYLSKLTKNKLIINLGGGLPSKYTLSRNHLCIDNYIDKINKINKNNIKIFIEPGRFIIEDSAFIETKILFVSKNYIIVDISTNFLIPLNNANYDIEHQGIGKKYIIFGRLCHDADIILNNAILKNPQVGDIIKVINCGAYTYSFRNNMGYPDPCIKVIT